MTQPGWHGAAWRCSVQLCQPDDITGRLSMGLVNGVVVDCDAYQFVDLDKRIIQVW